MLIKSGDATHPEEVCLDSQDENTVEVDYLCDGTERIIDLSSIPTSSLSNVTLASGGYTLSSGGGLTYTAGTGVTDGTWGPTSIGAIQAKDVILDGVSLKQLLEERLNLMVPNPELEKEWSELKQLGDAYRKLEADLKEKSRIWRALKKT